MENRTTTDSRLVSAARIVSILLTPFLIPTGAFVALFLFSYLRIMPTLYKLIVVGVVGCFTIILPLITIYIYCTVCRLKLPALKDRQRRYMPYLLTIISYVFCLFLMIRLNIPRYMVNIIFTALLIMALFLILSLKWRFSEHMGGAGAAIGGLISFSALFGYNPVWWLCGFILTAGILGTARIIAGEHKLNEILGGFTIGLVCSILILHPVSNLFFRSLFR